MIVFNQPYISEEVLDSIGDAFASRTVDEDGVNTQLSGDGIYTKRCHQWFTEFYERKNLLTHSCTAALEMSALLARLEPGDEVIMPSYTFVSTANAFVLRGAVPVFVDVRSDNFNIDENLIEAVITSKTRAIICVHYAGVACEMEPILAIAEKYGLNVIEDAAQALGATYKGKKLGTIGDFGCISFHETKNIGSGEGGLLLVNDEKFSDRAEILREKGTNRSSFFRGVVDKYTWVDMGSSYLPSDLIAAYLYPQLLNFKKIQQKRIRIWNHYYCALQEFEKQGLIRLPVINDFASNNAHMFYILLETLDVRSRFISFMKKNGIMTPFHYVPLHSAPAGLKYCRVASDMAVTNCVSERLVRLPLFYNLEKANYERVAEAAVEFIRGL